MELTLVLVIGIVSVVATSAVSERVGVAAPLSLVALGIALSLLPGVGHARIAAATPPRLPVLTKSGRL